MTIVVAAVIERDGRILIGQRKAGQRHALSGNFREVRWNRAKRPPDALRRELEEELAIQAEIGPSWPDYEYAYSERPAIRLIF